MGVMEPYQTTSPVEGRAAVTRELLSTAASCRRLQATLNGQSAWIDEGLLHCEDLPFLGNPVAQCGSSPRGLSNRGIEYALVSAQGYLHCRSFYGSHRERSLRQTATMRTPPYPALKAVGAGRGHVGVAYSGVSLWLLSLARMGTATGLPIIES